MSSIIFDNTVQENTEWTCTAGGGRGHVRGEAGEDGGGRAPHVGPVCRGEQGGRLLLYR
jgi:hypothetical protein